MVEQEMTGSACASVALETAGLSRDVLERSDRLARCSCGDVSRIG
jgi:hypothetical protein